jgi:serine/threonine protein kinase
MYNSETEELKRRIILKAKEYFPKLGKCKYIEEISKEDKDVARIYVLRIYWESESKDVLIKIIKKYSSGKEEYQALTHYYTKFKEVSNEYSVPRCLDFWLDLRALVMEKINGENLRKRLLMMNSTLVVRKRKNRLLNDCYRVGQWLKYFHSFYLKKEKFDYNKFLQELEKNLQYLEEQGFPKKILQDSKSITQVLLTQKIEKLWTSNSHNDFSPNNIIIADDGRIISYDFRFGADRECIYENIAKFCVMIETLNSFPQTLFYDYTFLKTLTQSFIQGYFDNRNMNRDELILIEVYKLKWLIRKVIVDYVVSNKYTLINSLVKSIRLNPFYYQRLKQYIKRINNISKDS